MTEYRERQTALAQREAAATDADLVVVSDDVVEMIAEAEAIPEVEAIPEMEAMGVVVANEEVVELRELVNTETVGATMERMTALRADGEATVARRAEMLAALAAKLDALPLLDMKGALSENHAHRVERTKAAVQTPANRHNSEAIESIREGWRDAVDACKENTAALHAWAHQVAQGCAENWHVSKVSIASGWSAAVTTCQDNLKQKPALAASVTNVSASESR